MLLSILTVFQLARVVFTMLNRTLTPLNYGDALQSSIQMYYNVYPNRNMMTESEKEININTLSLDANYSTHQSIYNFQYIVFLLKRLNTMNWVMIKLGKF